MSKIHYFQRYSSIENTVTNNTLQLLDRIYKHSTFHASEFLKKVADESIEIGNEIQQQKRADQSVPDGTIKQNSFRVLLESKVDAPVDEEQLLRHADNFRDESLKILLLLTKQKIGKKEKDIRQMISDKYPDVIFKNITYEGICKAVTGLFKDYEHEMFSLVEDYIEYCNDAKLFDQAKYLMRVLPCSQSIDINKKYGIYFHESDRSYTEHSFVGIYANKVVQCIWAIDSVFDIEYDGQDFKKKSLVQGRDTDEYNDKLKNIIKDAKTICGYEIETGHRFFCGNPIETDYKKSSPGGILGPRLINLKDAIGEFTDINDAAMKLRSKQWE